MTEDMKERLLPLRNLPNITRFDFLRVHPFKIVDRDNKLVAAFSNIQCALHSATGRFKGLTLETREGNRMDFDSCMKMLGHGYIDITQGGVQ